MVLNSIKIFEKFAKDYDQWFEKNEFTYKSEIFALKKFVPLKGKGIEIGIGTGRFAHPFNIKIGIEPSKAMAKIARKRGIKIIIGKAEFLPFKNDFFDFVLIVNSICFFQNPFIALNEVKRVLKQNGILIIGMIDKQSFLGKLYKSKKKFYKFAHFFSINKILKWLKKLEFNNVRLCQTIFKRPEEITVIEPIKNGYGKGGFVVVSAKNKSGQRTLARARSATGAKSKFI